ncbi:hypothetical protein B0F90DRAFT_1732684 [Multifurca ochricompacta]|uniref:Uncharacterized protein n=1 Tax=Multifurca ochricompacta TaxID=376703 RepID=A0AAD4M1C1_9AGAM|nr:hypothetical protein B0F90DRAFT_1732684 [Multifurca ochricompacta]
MNNEQKLPANPCISDLDLTGVFFFLLELSIGCVAFDDHDRSIILHIPMVHLWVMMFC